MSGAEVHMGRRMQLLEGLLVRGRKGKYVEIKSSSETKNRNQTHKQAILVHSAKVHYRDRSVLWKTFLFSREYSESQEPSHAVLTA